MSTYPTVRPSLTLDFQKSKQLDPRISFSRSSSATYVQGGVVKTADEHQARFEDEGLLIEESRTNLLQYSEEFNNVYWTPSNITVTANTTAAPSGSINADKLVASTTNSSHYVFTQVVVTAGTHTVSVYAKSSGLDWVTLNIYDGSGYRKFSFNVSTGEKGIVASGLSSTITPVSNGWYRITATYTSTVTGNNTIHIHLYGGESTENFLGDGVSGAYFWGAMVEAGSSPTSYIPTAGSTVTRAADFMEVVSGRLSDLWRRNVWTAIWEFKGATSYYGFQISNDSHRGDRSRVSTQPSGSPTRIDIGGRGVLSGNGPVWSKDTNYKIAVGIDTDFTTGVGTGSYAVNGEFMFTNNITTQANRQLSEIRFYYNNIGDNRLLNGHYSRVVLYPELLTAGQMQAITS